VDDPLFSSPTHGDAPGIAADLTILDEAALHVGLDADLHLLAAEGTRNEKLVGHWRCLEYRPQSDMGGQISDGATVDSQKQM
jgi:hypothetical protein